MKTREELNALKEEVEALSKKLAELTDEELAQVTGGGNNEEHNVMLTVAPTEGGTVTSAVSAPLCDKCHKKLPFCSTYDHGSVTCPFCGATVDF